jgi:hypothetical protein
MSSFFTHHLGKTAKGSSSGDFKLLLAIGIQRRFEFPVTASLDFFVQLRRAADRHAVELQL